MMGNKANIAIAQGWTPEEFVILYGHSSGYEMPEILRRAIERNQRWDDSQYFARIVFDSLTEGCQGGETGFGISTRVQDNSHPVLVADCEKQEVYTANEEDLSTPTSTKMKFSEYAALDKATWNTFN